MKASLDGMLLNVTTSLTNKVLLLEVYFLLRSKQSPIYFALTYFLYNYSIELFYIAITLSLLSGLIFIPALAVYTIFVGSLAWCGSKFMGLFKYEGIPIFAALSQHNRENSVSIEVAKSYANSNNDDALLHRIKEYEKSSLEQLTGETLATMNFFLLALIVWISYITGAPNFFVEDHQFCRSLYFWVCLRVLYYTFDTTGHDRKGIQLSLPSSLRNSSAKVFQK